jgi:FAD:protein FMN transferase
LTLNGGHKNMIQKKVLGMLVMLLSLMVVVGLTACQDTKNMETPLPVEGVVSRTELVLGTVVTLQIFDHGSETLLDQCMARLKEIEANMSVNLETSQITRINLEAQKSEKEISPITVSEDTFLVIKRGLYYGDLSQGVFDITFGPIIDLWRIGTEDARIPSKSEIEQALGLVDYKNVILDEEKLTVKVSEGMALDLGGIAKGYAADEIETILSEAGVKSAIINLGGNITVMGEKTENQPFKVGVQNPLDDRNEYLGILDVRDKTIVTSGDYERFFEKDGVRYHHIFDKTTGAPKETELSSVTVLTDASIDADALSTILFLIGIEAGNDLLKEIPGASCVYVTKSKEIFFSDEDIQSLFTLKDESFKIVGRQ